jgi:PAS domain S-box-containing protein
MRKLSAQKFFDFLEEPSRASIESGLARFLEQKHWSGTVRVRFRKDSRPLYFDCVLNAIVKADEVVGASVLGRDVTGQHEKELRFTELFETLQEGAYFSTPEGKLLDANPALVAVLGYARKEELLAVDPAALNVDPTEPPVLGRAPDDRGGVRSREIILRKKDGTHAIFHESSRAVWDAAGKLIRYQGTLVDVTERRNLERQLLQQEEFRRRLAGKLSRSYSGGRSPGAIHVRQFARARSAGYQSRGIVGQEDIRNHRSLAGTGALYPRVTASTR